MAEVTWTGTGTVTSESQTTGKVLITSNSYFTSKWIVADSVIGYVQLPASSSQSFALVSLSPKGYSSTTEILFATIQQGQSSGYLQGYYGSGDTLARLYLHDINQLELLYSPTYLPLPVNGTVRVSITYTESDKTHFRHIDPENYDYVDYRYKLVYYYNGTSFVPCEVKRYNGTTWKKCV